MLVGCWYGGCLYLTITTLHVCTGMIASSPSSSQVFNVTCKSIEVWKAGKSLGTRLYRHCCCCYVTASPQLHVFQDLGNWIHKHSELSNLVKNWLQYALNQLAWSTNTTNGAYCHVLFALVRNWASIMKVKVVNSVIHVGYMYMYVHVCMYSTRALVFHPSCMHTGNRYLKTFNSVACPDSDQSWGRSMLPPPHFIFMVLQWNLEN